MPVANQLVTANLSVSGDCSTHSACKACCMAKVKASLHFGTDSYRRDSFMTTPILLHIPLSVWCDFLPSLSGTVLEFVNKVAVDKRYFCAVSALIDWLFIVWPVSKWFAYKANSRIEGLVHDNLFQVRKWRSEWSVAGAPPEKWWWQVQIIRASLECYSRRLPEMIFDYCAHLFCLHLHMHIFTSFFNLGPGINLVRIVKLLA